MILLPAAFVLVILHRADGGQVFVNPAHITSLRVVEGALSPRIGGGHCVVGLTDRKFVAVLESCAEVAKLLRETNARQDTQH